MSGDELEFRVEDGKTIAVYGQRKYYPADTAMLSGDCCFLMYSLPDDKLHSHRLVNHIYLVLSSAGYKAAGCTEFDFESGIPRIQLVKVFERDNVRLADEIIQQMREQLLE